MTIVEFRPRPRRRRRVRAFLRWFLLARVEIDARLVFLAIGLAAGAGLASVAFYAGRLAQ